MIASTLSNIKFERSAEEVSPLGGLTLFRQFIESTGVDKALAEQLPQPGSNRGYGPGVHSLALILTMYAGGESIADTRKLRDDKALRKVLDLLVPSESAIGDWLRTMGDRNAVANINSINKDLIHVTFEKKGIKEVTFVSDPTIQATKKREAQMTYLGVKGYRPMLSFILELDWILHHEFREGNDNGRRLEHIIESVAQLPSDVRIKWFLLDAEFYQKDIVDYIDKTYQAEFIICADQDAAVKAVIATIEKWEVLVDKDGIKTDREIGETVHIFNNGAKAFRLIVKRWKHRKTEEYCYHCLITNNIDLTTQEIALKYNTRSDAENIISELKTGFSLRKLPCGTLKANAVYFALAILCHNLFVAQKHLTLPPTLRKSTIKSIRWHLVMLAMRMGWKLGKKIVTLYVTMAKFNQFLGISRRNYVWNTA
jgi:hypothetical protein